MKNVLVAPLDWGLGHATRCIPIVRELLKKGCNVSIAGSGSSLLLLKDEFPKLQHFELQPYNPVYPERRGGMVWKMASQLPKFYQAIKKEHDQIEQLVNENKFDLVISDNRYGCWSQRVPCVFITHQSNILMPKRFGWLSPLVSLINKRLMKKFDYCWIPDFPDGNNLSGNLNRFSKHEKDRFRFIGTLSRFKASGRKREVLYDATIIISGPEPQRSIFEKIVRLQLGASDIRYCLVRGAFNPAERSMVPNIHDYLDTEKLQDVIEVSRIVVARSGYSTVMDMAALGKKVIFVPTPGQTEQEYLARRLHAAGIAFSCPQHQFDLQYALVESRNFTGFRDFPAESGLLSDAIDSVLNVRRVVKISSRKV